MDYSLRTPRARPASPSDIIRDARAYEEYVTGASMPSATLLRLAKTSEGKS